MRDRERDVIIVHLTGAGQSGWRHRSRYLDLPLAALILGIIGVSIVRGKSVVATVVLFGFAAIVFGAYYFLRRSNVTLFLRAGRIGTTNALGFRRAVPAADVQALVLCSADLAQGRPALPMLLVISKSGHCALRLTGADRLNMSGLREVARSASVELRGSWSDVLTLAHLEAAYPGATPRASQIIGWPLEHRGVTRLVVISATVVIIAGLVFVTTRH